MSNIRFRHVTFALLTVAALALSAGELRAQDLEPRRWSHLPTGLHVFGSGLVVMDGDILFDPVMQIEDGTFRLYSVSSSYVHSFEWLGKSSRIDVKVPYANGRWEGLVDGEYAAIRRHGFGDPRLRLSMLLYGSPPLSGSAFAQYRAEHPVATSLGAALTVVLPWGEYYPDRLINLGGNRYVIRPSVGLVHRRGPWEFEATLSLSFYEDNDAYYGDALLEQDRAWFLQGHVTRTMPRGHWLSLSGGFSYGGESRIDGASLDNSERTRFYSLGWGIPLTRQQSLRIAWVNADTNVVIGTRSDSLLLSWSLAWGL